MLSRRFICFFLQESPIFHGKIDGFRLRFTFSLKPIHWFSEPDGYDSVWPHKKTYDYCLKKDIILWLSQMHVFLYLEIIPKGYLQRKMMSNHQVIASFQGRTHPFHMSVIKKTHCPWRGGFWREARTGRIHIDSPSSNIAIIRPMIHKHP